MNNSVRVGNPSTRVREYEQQLRDQIISELENFEQHKYIHNASRVVGNVDARPLPITKGDYKTPLQNILDLILWDSDKEGHVKFDDYEDSVLSF